MQALDWNDFRYVLALMREGSQAAAARQLGVDPTTVSRRLRAIETVLGVPLFERGADGSMRLTQAGEMAARRAENVEAELGGLTEALQGADALASGTVRVTAVPLLINRVLVPAAADLMAQHPQLRVELIAKSRDLNLTRREADIALRLARPTDDTGSRVLSKRIGTLTYAAYVANDVDAGTEKLPWLTYEEGMAHLPQARWIAKAVEEDGIRSPLAVNDAEAMLQGVEAGLGRGLLPCMVADQISGLRRIHHDGPAFPEREIWLLTHPDLRHLARIAAVLAWVEASIRKV
ncbi:LysR family transcriptional regulator (plasmid) [Rhizobium sp. B230/85]|uniref:LysR family transcriptional regulator n=1 Tax=unclassified Rhizobium TaxID=2613769 RepID=UPI001AD98560|nr:MULTISPECIES: LysR family transcriptional regulator [unclassified Rhizobium]MBO9136631.1 LysR family transcriptional regulator [Rhizobium sp. B209b/85]QXZ99760.1 LysR family transcriptional regulator [Rhizobium sp. B230/85]